MHLDKSAGDIKGKDILGSAQVSLALPEGLRTKTLACTDEPGAPPFVPFERWDSTTPSLIGF
jgi:hypothetical protein